MVIRLILASPRVSDPVTLCSAGSCCPVVKLAEDRVEIGEEGNLCILKPEEWEALKSKVLNEEI